MFCINCGTKLEEEARFCINCGKPVSGEVTNQNNTINVNANQTISVEQKSKVKVEDKEVVLNVKPTFNALYVISPYLTTIIMFLAPLVVFMYILLRIENGNEISSLLIKVFGIILLCLVALIFISLYFTSKQYKAYNYDFYKTKVVYKDSFINISEKEVKYKYIREVYLRRTFFQRLFGLGSIILYTNAESGFGNGICINDLSNSEEIYKKIKEIIEI